MASSGTSSQILQWDLRTVRAYILVEGLYRSPNAGRFLDAWCRPMLEPIQRSLRQQVDPQLVPRQEAVQQRDRGGDESEREITLPPSVRLPPVRHGQNRVISPTRPPARTPDPPQFRLRRQTLLRYYSTLQHLGTGGTRPEKRISTYNQAFCCDFRGLQYMYSSLLWAHLIKFVSGHGPDLRHFQMISQRRKVVEVPSLRTLQFAVCSLD